MVFLHFSFFSFCNPNWVIGCANLSFVNLRASSVDSGGIIVGVIKINKLEGDIENLRELVLDDDWRKKLLLKNLVFIYVIVFFLEIVGVKLYLYQI